jgi:hypothetical protein
MQQIQWNFDEATQCWSAVTKGCEAVVQPNADHGVYLAWIEPRERDMPLYFAPQAFADRQDAQQWCEEALNNHLDLEAEMSAELSTPL